MQSSLIGMKFGRWSVVEKAPGRKCGRSRWHCVCECGRTSIVFGYALRSGKSASCGHHAGKRKVDRTTTRRCIECGNDYKLPLCRLKTPALCSTECRKAALVARKESKKKTCLICFKPFYPRPVQVRVGQGKVCSVACRSKHFKTVPRSEQWRKNISISQKGRPGKCGPDNPKWKGGYEHCYRKRLKDGRIREHVKRYRRANPHKVRDWEQNRHGRKTGSLPKGTVLDLIIKQKNRCAYCQVKLKKYHIDHIVPLAKGGVHDRSNVQLLCPTCNVRKWAKDPIVFRREQGYLL